MCRMFGAAAVGLLAVAVAQAHFPFVVPDAGGSSAKVVFSDDLNPDPNVNAPACKKNSASVPSPAPEPVRVSPLTVASTLRGPTPVTARRLDIPPPYTIAPKMPAARNSQTISAPAMTVTVQTPAAIAHSRGSRLLVVRASFTDAMATIATIAGPTPRNSACTTDDPWFST